MKILQSLFFVVYGYIKTCSEDNSEHHTRRRENLKSYIKTDHDSIR
jgi:hypothetical protein